MKKNKVFFLFLILLFCGCYDRVDINRLEIVVGIALDLTEDNKIKASVQVLKPTTFTNGGDENGASEPFVQIESLGDTVTQALRNANFSSPNRLYFAHNRIVIFSERFARQEGLHHAIDWFIRGEEPREDVYLAICSQEASEVLKTKIPTGPIPALEMTKIIQTSVLNSAAPITMVMDLAQNIAAKTPFTVLGRFEKAPSGDGVIYLGGATIKGYHFYEYLTQTEIRGYNWLIGRFKSGLCIAKIPDTDNLITFEIQSAKSKITPVLIDNQLSFKVEAKVVGRIVKMESSETLLDPYAWPEFIKEFQRQIKGEMESAIDKARLSGDFLGLGDITRKSLPTFWNRQKSDWDRIWPHVPFFFDIKIDIKSVGKLNKFM